MTLAVNGCFDLLSWAVCSHFEERFSDAYLEASVPSAAICIYSVYLIFFNVSSKKNKYTTMRIYVRKRRECKPGTVSMAAGGGSGHPFRALLRH